MTGTGLRHGVDEQAGEGAVDGAAEAPQERLRVRSHWVHTGTELFLDTLDGLDDSALDGACALPGWTRRHLVAHVCGNAEALGRLADWARTGVPTPMYSSPGQRDADIESGSRLAPDFLRTWAVTSAEALDAKLAALTDDQWTHPVTTAQGREVAAGQIPWLRAREVLVHTVDLADGPAFADLPHDFLLALIDDVAAKRSAGATGPALTLEITGLPGVVEVAGAGPAVRVSGGAPAIAAWLTGRPGGRLRHPDRPALPDLPPWL